MTSLPRKPIWPESGGIPPQHRQFPDAYAEDLTTCAFGAVAPFGWGISKFAFDQPALTSGVVRVVELEGRFSSGLPAMLAPREALTRELGTRRDAAGVRVHVAVANETADSPNMTDGIGESAARYRLVTSRGASALRPNLRLLFDDEGAASYERLSVARVLVDTGRPELDPWSVPPLLRVFPGSQVAMAVRHVVAALASRRAELLSALAARPFDVRAFAPARAPQLLLLSSINRALAIVDHADPSVHLSPPALHDVLADLLGTLESLRGRTDGAILSYVHHDPGPGFRSLVERIVATLPSVARDPHVGLPLERKDAWTFSVSLREPELFRRKAYLVASGVDERALSAHLPAHAKIASHAWLPNLVQSATRGVPIATEFDPPASLPSSANHCCFKVDTRSELWADVIQQGSLMVHVPEAPNGLALTVYALLGDRP